MSEASPQTELIADIRMFIDVMIHFMSLKQKTETIDSNREFLSRMIAHAESLMGRMR